MDGPGTQTLGAAGRDVVTTFLAAVPSGVICDDHVGRRRSVSGLMSRSGFGVAGEFGEFAPLREMVLRCRPTVAVVALSLVGMSGLEAVRLLRRDAPESQIVLLSSFSRLVPEAVAAGARALVPEDDPRLLLDVLAAVAAAHHRVVQVQRVSRSVSPGA